MLLILQPSRSSPVDGLESFVSDCKGSRCKSGGTVGCAPTPRPLNLSQFLREA